ncbi:hypothetical protein KC335_g14616 [Hortaea werneckii]|nr:hypothetical protein KC335_g14616 [Hortaea werneckii]
MSKHPLRLMSDTSSASLSPAVQTLQHHIRADLHHNRHKHNNHQQQQQQQQHRRGLARGTGSDDAESLQVLEIATTKATNTRPAGRRGMARSGCAGSESLVSSRRRDGGRTRGPGRGRKATASTFATGGDGGMGMSGSSLVGVETVPRGEQTGTNRLGIGRGGPEWQEYSLLTMCKPIATKTATGVAAATPGIDDDDDETWNLLATPPSPNTTDPELSVSRNGDNRPDPLIPFHQSRNPSPTSRSVTVSTSSSERNWRTGVLRYQNNEQEEEAEGEDEEESSLSFANERGKKQYPSARGGSFDEWNDPFSSASSSSSQWEHQQEQQAQPHPPSRPGVHSPRASRRVREAVQECAIPGDTEPQRRDDGGVGVRSRWGVGLSGVGDEEGWGGVGRGGGVREGRDEGDEGDDEWEMV